MKLLLFQMFSAFAVLASLMVILLYNPVHSVLFLILSFVNCTFLFLLIEAEFLALVFLIIYIGAIAILFLFIIMMLNIKDVYVEWKDRNIPFILFCVLGVNSFLIPTLHKHFYQLSSTFEYRDKTNALMTFNEVVYVLKYKINDIHVFSHLLYTHYSFYLFLGAFILLIAMVGSILLTLEDKSNKIVKAQANFKDRSYLKSISLRSLKK